MFLEEVAKKENNARAAHLGNLIKICILLCFMIIFGREAGAFEDPMNCAAIKSPLAPKSLLLDIAFSGDRIIAVGERGHIIFSDDNGRNWQQAEVPVQIMLTSVTFPGRGRTGWAAGHAGIILTSHDAGKTWVKQIDGNQVNKIIADAFTNAVAEKKKILNTVSAEERSRQQEELEELEFQLTDAKSFVDEGPSRPFLDIYFHDERNGYAVGTFGMIIQTFDGGESWSSPAPLIENPDAYHYTTIKPIVNILFLIGEKGFVSRSSNNGKSWKHLKTPYNGTFFDITGDENSIMLVGLRGNALLSSDRGENWIPVETGVKTTLSSAQILSDGRILVSRYAKSLMISNLTRTSLSKLPLSAGKAVSSFVLGRDDDFLITVGIGGITRIVDPNFTAEIN